MSTHNFLFELGCEELPPTSLKPLAMAFYQSVSAQLHEHNLSFDYIHWFATPRRIAVMVEKLSAKTPVEETALWGPPAKIAFDGDGKATKAAEAFASKNGLSVDELQTANDGKIDKLFVKKNTGGEKSAALLPKIIDKALNDLPIAKRMRWGKGREEFVRPAQWCVALLDANILPLSVMGISSDRYTVGHRFHHPEKLNIDDAKNYEAILLNKGNVVADFAKRQAMIVDQVEAEAKKLNGKAVISEELLDEVTALVELPQALAGNFDEEFLRIPSAALVSSMKEHQKYFHVVDENTALLPHFITVANIKSEQPELIIDGNERVIRPRLADAAFFFDTDKAVSLESRLPQLGKVVFQAKLGTVLEKCQRIEKLAEFIASKIKQGDTNLLAESKRAAQLCKADLVSLMVYEFPDMQGIAGRHYALNDGEPENVALAIEQHYQPRFAGDALPENSIGNIIALADRIDTIVGIFGIGQIPTGSKDPFALRRASLGALRILVENKMDIDLRDLILHSVQQFAELPNTSVVDDVLTYMIERFKSWYEDAGMTPQIFMAVNAKGLTHPLDIDTRVRAVAKFVELPQAPSLAAANKRVANILAKQDADKQSAVLDQSLLQEKAERNLAGALAEKSQILASSSLNYERTLTELADLQAPVDAFFDDVMVMCDDEALRNNRLALLSKLRALFLDVADISYLVIK